jgi:hypothetical protein
MPMKCIKSIKETPNTKLGTILRVKDSEADEKVTKGNWQYIAKSEWKGLTRKSKSDQATDQVTVKSSKQSKKQKAEA